MATVKRSWNRWLLAGLKRFRPLWDNEKRGINRTPVNCHARLALSETSYLVEIADISTGGCALNLREGLLPHPDREVQVVFPGKVRHKCKVRWTSGSTIGLEFDEPIVDYMDLVRLEHLGENYFRALIRIQSKL